jgi:hypothetical protein
LVISIQNMSKNSMVVNISSHVKKYFLINYYLTLHYLIFYLLKQTARTVGPLKQSKKIKIKNKNNN